MGHNLRFRILDYDGQVIVSDNSSVLILQSVESDSTVEGETQRVAVKGEFLFADLKFTAQPPSVVTFIAKAPFINEDLVTTALKSTPNPLSKVSFFIVLASSLSVGTNFNMTFRDCVAGETKLSDT